MVGRIGEGISNASFRCFGIKKSEYDRPNLCFGTSLSHKKGGNSKKSFFSLITEGLRHEKIHFYLFFMKFHLFASPSVFRVKKTQKEAKLVESFWVAMPNYMKKRQ